jgi:hypothetical protein
MQTVDNSVTKYVGGEKSRLINYPVAIFITTTQRGWLFEKGALFFPILINPLKIATMESS